MGGPPPVHADTSTSRFRRGRELRCWSQPGLVTLRTPAADSPAFWGDGHPSKRQAGQRLVRGELPLRLPGPGMAFPTYPPGPRQGRGMGDRGGGWGRGVTAADPAPGRWPRSLPPQPRPRLSLTAISSLAK